MEWIGLERNGVDVCMNKVIFQKYWKILKRNYNDKNHTQEDMKTYYSIFKDVSNEDFIEVIKLVLKNQKYFPNIAEINQYVEKITNENQRKGIVPEWMKKEPEKEKPTEEEEKEMEELLKEFE